MKKKTSAGYVIVLLFHGAWALVPEAEAQDLLRECLKGIRGYRLTTRKLQKGQVAARVDEMPWEVDKERGPSWTLTRPARAQQRQASLRVSLS